MKVVSHFRVTGEWNPTNGPPPGSTGCRVPPHLVNGAGDRMGVTEGSSSNVVHINPRITPYQPSPGTVDADARERGPREKTVNDGEPPPDDGEDPRAARLEAMNKDHHVVNHHGKTLVLTWDLEDEIYPGRPIATYRTSAEFCKFYNKWSIVWTEIKKDKKGNEVEVTIAVPLGDWWWNNSRRKQYGGIIYAPDTEKELIGTKLNLWRGFTVEPSEEKGCQSYLDHLRNNICVDEDGKPVQAYYDYLIGWMAHCVQHPERQGYVAVVLIGDKGTGKTVAAEEFGKLFGLHYIAITNPDHLVGKFNAHLQLTSVLLGDECFFAGDPRHENSLKTLTTGDRLWIEPKGINSYAVKNFLHIILCTNQPWAVPASHDERRYFVLKVSKNRIQDIPYFKALCDEMENGGRATLLATLKNLDLSKHTVDGRPFEVRRAPETSELREQKKHSLPVDLLWWQDILAREYVYKSKYGLEEYFRQWHEWMATEMLYESYMEFSKSRNNRHPMPKTIFGGFLTKMGCKPMRPKTGVVQEHQYRDYEGLLQAKLIEEKRPTGYRIGPLDIARKDFEKHTGLTFVWEAPDAPDPKPPSDDSAEIPF